MLNRLLPPGTAQRSYMLSLIALIISTLVFFPLGALTKNNPNPGTGLLIFEVLLGSIIIACVVYSILKHMQGVMRVSKMEDSEKKSLYMALSMVGGGLFLLVMAFYLWMNLFVIGFILDRLLG